MKNQLLEDIDDSQSGVSAFPIRRVQRPSAVPAREQASVSPSQAPPAGQMPRQRAGVWRSRPAVGPQVQAPWPEPPRPPQPQHQPQPQRAHVWTQRAPEAPHMAPETAPEIASFSSREPDWSIPLQPEPPSWTERWGRKALGWTVGLGAAAAVAAVVASMYRDTQVESTLAVVAGHSAARTPASPAVVAPSAPATPVTGQSASVPLAEVPLSDEPPPLRMLPPEAPAVAQAAAPEAPQATASVAEPVVAAPPPAPRAAAVAPKPAAGAAKPAAGAAKPAARRVAERRSADPPAKRSRPEAKKPAAKPARERMLARAPAAPPAAPVRPAPQPAAAAPADPIDQFAETLRLCRAAGYHANACLKRGCEATRFGLVCRG